MSISAVIITFNSQKTIERCIKSVISLVDEILIVDSGSTDNTLEIAKKYNSVIKSTEWLGYGETKNLGHKLATSEYVLSLDSDEYLSEDLFDNIKKIKHTLEGIYSFRRLNYYCGKWIRYGDWNPDVKIRLFPRNLRWDNSESHENLVIGWSEKNTVLRGYLMHLAYNSSTELIQKTKLYARLGSKSKIDSGIFINILKSLFSPMVKFIKGYFFKLGFLDGYKGLIIAFHNSYGTYLKYYYAYQANFMLNKTPNPGDKFNK